MVKHSSNMTAETQTATYSMAEDTFKQRRPRHRRGSTDNNDDNGSLTYSAGSSCSITSSAGESTDSSFSDIMRVLDLQDSKELEEFIQREGVDPRKYSIKKQNKDEKSVSSLAYSTDADSNLNGGEGSLQTISGQPSDSGGPDGGGGSGSALGISAPAKELRQEHNDIFFAPADPAEKRKKKSKRMAAREALQASLPSEAERKSILERSSLSMAAGALVGTPPPGPPRQIQASHTCGDEEVWYAKWWMCGFTDAFTDLNLGMPKQR